MAISWSKAYIARNPGFELTQPGSRPSLALGEMTIVYECLEKFGPRVTLSELVQRCLEHGLASRFKNPATDPTLCVLYHLKRMEEGTIGRKKHAERRLIREI